jgi:thiamine kinase-like enzyme
MRALPTDPALPHLVHALDPQAMAQTFAGLLAGLNVRACEVDRVKYRPGRSCSVSYKLLLHDARHDRAFEQRVAARFCSGGDAQRRHRQAMLRPTVASAAGPRLSHLAEFDMLAHWLPNDTKLAALALLCDDAELRRRCLPEVVAALTEGHGRLVEHHTKLVQIVPELRVCARVELQVQPHPGAAMRVHTLFAKADVERNGAATQALMQALHLSPAQAQGALRTPRPLLWQEHAGLHWQCAVAGSPLEDYEPGVGPVTSARLGAQLAALHATPLGGLRCIDIGELQAQVHRSAAMLSAVEPEWQPLLARLAAHLDAGAAALAAEPAASLHGDLHPRNILVNGEKFAFIDLDGVQAGPAVFELGAWVADTLYRAALGGVAPLRAWPGCHAFLVAHASASGRAADGALLAWSTAQDLLCKRAYRCVANLKPGRFEIVPQLLAWAGAIAAAGDVEAALTPALEWP